MEHVKVGFGRFATWTAHYTGSPWAFMLAALVIIGWGVSGPLFHFSNTWQLVINTGTTIITFLMIFLIQYTQNRDTKAIIVKLDELIRSTTKADNRLMDLETLSDEELDRLEEQMRRLARPRGRRKTA